MTFIFLIKSDTLLFFKILSILIFHYIKSRGTDILNYFQLEISKFVPKTLTVA